MLQLQFLSNTTVGSSKLNTVSFSHPAADVRRHLVDLPHRFEIRALSGEILLGSEIDVGSVAGGGTRIVPGAGKASPPTVAAPAVAAAAGGHHGVVLHCGGLHVDVAHRQAGAAKQRGNRPAVIEHVGVDVKERQMVDLASFAIAPESALAERLGAEPADVFDDFI